MFLCSLDDLLDSNENIQQDSFDLIPCNSLGEFYSVEAFKSNSIWFNLIKKVSSSPLLRESTKVSDDCLKKSVESLLSKEKSNYNNDSNKCSLLDISSDASDAYSLGKNSRGIYNTYNTLSLVDVIDMHNNTMQVNNAEGVFAWAALYRSSGDSFKESALNLHDHISVLEETTVQGKYRFPTSLDNIVDEKIYFDQNKNSSIESVLKEASFDSCDFIGSNKKFSYKNKSDNMSYSEHNIFSCNRYNNYYIEDSKFNLERRNAFIYNKFQEQSK